MGGQSLIHMIYLSIPTINPAPGAGFPGGQIRHIPLQLLFKGRETLFPVIRATFTDLLISIAVGCPGFVSAGAFFRHPHPFRRRPSFQEDLLPGERNADSKISGIS